MGELRRVIIVCDVATISGGAAKVALDGAMGLARRGIETHLFSAVEPIAPELEQAGVKVTCIGQQYFLGDSNRFAAARRGIWNDEAKSAFHSMLQKFSPKDTVVHVQQWMKALSPSVYAPVVENRFPFTVTLHDYFIACPQGGFLVVPTGEVCERRPMSLSCVACNCDPRNYAQKLWRVARQVGQNRVLFRSKALRHVVYVSDRSRSVLEPVLPSYLNWHFVPNPIEVPHRPRVDPTQNRDYVFVGRLSKEKGVGIFAHAAREAGVPAVFIGDGDQHDSILEINPDAEMAGWLKPGEVLERLAASRALVFPSIWHEMQGMAVAEAASLGVPALVAEHCAAADAIVNNETGLLAMRGSVGDLVIKLRRMQDDTLVDRLSKAAYERFWNAPPTMQRHVDALLQTYDAVLTSP